MKFEDGIKICTLVVASIGAAMAIFTYIKAQKWKKVEFLAKVMKEFYEDFNVKRALLMLDWSVFKIPLANGEIDKKEYFLFSDKLLLSALIHHEEKLNGAFTQEEALIRLLFDTLFEKLTTIQNYLDNRLFSFKDLKPHLVYYMKIIGDPESKRKDDVVRKQIISYIQNYQESQTMRLIERFNK